MQTSSDINASQPADNNPRFNAGSRINFDLFKFDSLMKDFRADAPVTRTEPEVRTSDVNDVNSKRDDEVRGGAHPAEKRSAINDDTYRETSGQVNRKSEPSERRSDINDDKSSCRPEKLNAGSHKTEKKAEADTRHGNQVQAGNDRAVSQPIDTSATDSGTASGLNTGSMIARVPGSEVETLIDTLHSDSSNNEGNAKTSGDAVLSGSKTTAEQLIKTGDLLSDVFNRGENIAKGSELSVSQLVPENSLKTDALLANLINTAQAKSAESPVMPKVTGETAVPVNNEVAVAENEMKTAVLLNNVTDRSVSGNNTGLEENALHTAIRGSAIRTGEDEDLAKGSLDDKNSEVRSERNMDAKKAHPKESHILKNESEMDLATSIKGQRDMSGRVIGQYAEHLNREFGAKTVISNNARPVNINSDTSNSSTIHSPGATIEGVKANQGPHMGSVTRPSAFSEVVDKIVYIAKGNGRLVVRIENETLGKLNIKVSMDKGLVHVHINTAEKVVREMLENNMQHIVDSLSKNGVSVGGFSVGLRNHKNNEYNGNTNGQGSGNEHGFSIDKVLESQYINNAVYVSNMSGMVNIFA